MFCPNCGQEKTNSESSFCSGCGFLLTGTAQLLAVGGQSPATGDSKRKRGMKQGLFIFLSAFLIVPLLAAMSLAAGFKPWVAIFAAILLAVGGFLRAAYAWLFEMGEGKIRSLPAMQSVPKVLPDREPLPAPAYAAGNWRDTNDLVPSVTESTTRSLVSGELRQ